MSRLLTIMGSGETAPTMVKVHRELLERSPGPAVMLDTPFGFQENAPEIAERAARYFRDSVGADLQVLSLVQERGDPVADARALQGVRDAAYVFAGPGSPSYALRQWRGTTLASVLADKLRAGGAVTFASAAALTLGIVTVPVYEIYKVGEPPRWLEGLDLLAAAGLCAAVVPHYDNAEGGHHDTRFCYLGERRLAALEADLPAGAFVLGLDEHTACILDLEAGTAEVAGLGVVTARHHGRSVEYPAGTTVTITTLAEPPAKRTTARAAATDAPAPEEAATPESVGTARSPLLERVADAETSFTDALATGDADGAVRAALALEAELAEWGADTLQSDEMARGRDVLRSMVVRLGEAATVGLVPRREVVAPWVEALLEARERARADRRWAESDQFRERLAELGVEVRDTPEGTQWGLLS